MTKAINPYRQFDKQGYPVLLDPYIMAYDHWDGFTERLLHFTLLVDQNYHLQLAYHSYQWNGEPSADFDLGFNSTHIPNCIQAFLMNLRSDSVNDLKNEYPETNIVADDAGKKEYLFKVGGATKYISINTFTLLTDRDFEKPIEKDFFALHQMIEQWTGELYDSYEKLCAMPLHPKNKRK